VEKRGDQKETPTEVNARGLIELKQELSNYKTQMDAAIGQLFQNQQNMKEGLDSAEINLRVFQKVLNGMQEKNILLVPAPEQHPMSEISVPAAKINWPEYYKLVDAEMQAMAAAALEVEKHRTQVRLKVLVEDKKLEWLKEKINKQISEQKAEASILAQQMQNAERFFESAQVHIDRAQRGEPYDTNRLDQLLNMITAADKKDAEKTGAVHQDEAPAEALGRLSYEDSEHEGDDVVFGGDIPPQEESNAQANEADGS
jgi:hypothetical protein